MQELKFSRKRKGTSEIRQKIFRAFYLRFESEKGAGHWGDTDSPDAGNVAGILRWIGEIMIWYCAAAVCLGILAFGHESQQYRGLPWTPRWRTGTVVLVNQS